MKSASELFNDILKYTTDELYCQLPATITKVSNDSNYVSAIIHINDEEPDVEAHNIRVRHLESQRAFIFLGIKKGDRGVVRFFDRSTEGYLQSDFDYNSDERQHDINDRCFELGFVPDKESYVYPSDKEIVIGLKNQKFTLSVDNEGVLNITSVGEVNITANNINSSGNLIHTGNITINGNITATGEITGNGIPLSSHVHGNGNQGADTTAPKL